MTAIELTTHSILDALLDGVEGFLHPDEPAFYAALASQVQPRRAIVEIGSYRGRSTIALAWGAPDGVLVYAVDPHVEHVVEGLPFGMADNQVFMANVSRAGLGHKIRVINFPAAIAAHQFATVASIGLLFIDGNHTYDAVRQDVILWGQYVVPGGLMALHDANTWVGPTQAADELAASDEWDEVPGCAYTRVFRKVRA